MFTRYTQGKCLYGLAIGIIFLIMTFANCFTAWAENSSQVIIKQSPEQTGKPLVRPTRKKSETKYNVETGPIKIIAPQKQTQAPDRLKRKHGESVSSSNDKIKIDVGPVKKISPAVPENVKIGDGVKSGRQRQLPEGTGTSGNIQVEPISISPIPSEEGKNVKEGNKRYETQIGPIKTIDTEDIQKTQSPIRERIKVTGVRSWKLDESGNKTNEEIMDSNEVIEGINQPPSEVNK